MKRYLIVAAVVFALMLVLPLPAFGVLEGDKSVPPSSGASAPSPGGNASSGQAPAEEATFKILDVKSGEVVEMGEREFLIGTVANELYPTYHSEAMKAQAVAAYTYYGCKRTAERKNPTPELKGADFSDVTSRFPDGYTVEGLQERWGGNFDTYYKKVCDAVDAVLLVPAGRETHSFEPTPLDVIRLSQADVFVYNGGESEYWVEEILDSAGEEIPYTLRLMDYAQPLEEELAEGMQGAGHDDHHDHDDGHEDEVEYDEHIWTSPRIAMGLCRAIAGTLQKADPEHAQNYARRLETYLAELSELDQAFTEVVADGNRHMVVFGDRFPLLYFCKTYGLEYRAAFHGCAGDTEPSLATLKYLIDKVQEEGIPVVYTIELSSRKVAQALAETTGAKVLTFQSCQTVSRQDFDAGATYLSLMRQNVAALKEGLA